MGSLFTPLLLPLFCLCLTLISPTHSTDCSSLKLSGGKKQYSNCTHLPTLNATLHFTYNATNSSLSIAFSAPPAKAGGWIAWAVNPTGTGMAGSQALLAFKNNGSMVVKTYNISSYSSIVEGKLSFDVWDLEAEAGSDGKMVLYGSLKVEESAEKLNQVWQVGPGIADGHPMKHEFDKANLGSVGELQLVEKLTPSSPSPSPQVANANSGYGLRVTQLNRWGLDRVLIQTDNLEVVKIIQERQLASANSVLVRRILQLLKLVGYWRIRHVPREENRVADSLAKTASGKKEDIRVFEEVLEELSHLLEFDIDKNAFDLY
ncbi:hypothetical protein Gotri_021389 [Gossypium trilobum]|uniref:DOMON domain-containing protein n=1 Tax=Gossypium trilobum TaxID=34281 RepID=A0A7J9DCR9_9ROSI|nr:hypothetical protein [Gossypium trilobum]